jgi:hypothetical protein
LVPAVQDIPDIKVIAGVMGVIVRLVTGYGLTAVAVAAPLVALAALPAVTAVMQTTRSPAPTEEADQCKAVEVALLVDTVTTLAVLVALPD